MGAMSIQLIVAFAVTSIAGSLMIMQGLSVKLLERRAVRCRSCGGVPGRSCSCNRD